MSSLKIDVYEYPSSRFLGTRFAPYLEFENGEPIISNAEDINSEVEYVAKLHNKKENEFFFKTTVIKK
jgi:hypothetical protein